MIECDANSLANAARCLSSSLGSTSLLAIEVYLLAIMTGQSTDPNVLMEQAKCMKCIPQGLFPAVIASILCRWANVDVTGQTCLVCVADDGTPEDPPADGCTCAIAYNDIGQFWFWSTPRNLWMPISV